MTPATAPAKLPVFTMLYGAFVVPWAHRRAFAKALALPAAALVAIQVGSWQAGEEPGTSLQWATWAADAILWMLFAVICHRLVLLGLEPKDVPIVPGWGARETRFLAWLLAIYVITLAVTMAALTVGTMLIQSLSPSLVQAIVDVASKLIGTYLFARLALVLPAAAIDAPTNLVSAWWRTRGNGWRMAVIVTGLPWGSGYLVSIVYGDEPGLMQAILVTVLGTALLVVEIAALSLSYRHLEAGPP
ncbi:MAG: hypothetical protein ACXWHB_00615 [Usitatibacter sp.]